MQRHFRASFEASEDVLVERALSWLKAARYRRRALSSEPGTIRARRGGLLGSIVGLSPRAWRTELTLRLTPREEGGAELDVTWEINDRFQFVTANEAALFDSEVSELHSCLAGRPGGDESKRRIAEATRQNLVIVLASTTGAVIVLIAFFLVLNRR